MPCPLKKNCPNYVEKNVACSDAVECNQCGIYKRIERRKA